jgi:hypothetical protein
MMVMSMVMMATATTMVMMMLMTILTVLVRAGRGLQDYDMVMMMLMTILTVLVRAGRGLQDYDIIGTSRLNNDVVVVLNTGNATEPLYDLSNMNNGQTTYVPRAYAGIGWDFFPSFGDW